ncbi:MAG: FAD-dependent oxidoreductase [Myxococcales bacterium]|nr:FAD-dependent oxidoreductase [Myxococcales bacterium]MDD9969034.1 FAD-dependent oxidoreductase [Myxococcales bacterium]
MSSSYFDVVVLGLDPAPLACGALLAKRGFRVLLLGQGQQTPDYHIGNFRLPRRIMHTVSAKSPVVHRLVSELGISQSFRRLSTSHEEAFQVAMPRHRFDITHDRERLSRELKREFPEVKRPIEDYHVQVERLSASLDEMLRPDVVWPPTTFLERRALARAHARSGLPRRGEEDDVLAEFPEDHAFRMVTQAPSFFSSGAPRPSSQALGSVRLYDNMFSRQSWLEGGLGAWTSMLIDRIRAHAGQVRLADRASAINVRRGKVHGVRLFGADEEVAADFVVVGVDVNAMLSLVPERSAFEETFERFGEPQLRHYRYLLNAVVSRHGTPAGMGRSVFFLDEVGLDGAAEHALYIERRDADEDHYVISAEALLPAQQVEGQAGDLEGARDRVLKSLTAVVPFIEQNAIVVDSPHDGLAPVLARDMHMRPEALGQRGRRTLPATYSFPGERALGLCALPIRGPIRNLLLCNSQVVPALGAEGELVAAASAARVVTSADRARDWKRRGRWNKLDI